VPGSLAGNFEAFGPGPVVFVAPGGLHWRAVSRHVDDALDGGRDRAGPWDGDCGDARVLRRAACFAGSIHHFPGLDTLAQLQLDVFWGQPHALDVAFGGGGGLGGGDGIRKPITPTLLAEKLFRSGRRDVRRK